MHLPSFLETPPTQEARDSLEEIELESRPSRSEISQHKTISNSDATGAPLLDNKAENDQARSPGWPSEPSAVRVDFHIVVWRYVVDVLLFLLAVAFYSFAMIVRSYDGVPTNSHPVALDRLLNATTYGPTVFPILFAAIVGRAAQHVLVWLLEKGARIGVLDTLAGSTSLTSTVTSLIRLRVTSILGIVLIAIWALSPVGGQASFRQLDIGIKTTHLPAEYDYLVPSSDVSGYQQASEAEFGGIVNTLFNAAVIAPFATKTSPRDLWGNVKIPRLEHYEYNDSAIPDDAGWYNTDVEANDDVRLYASLTGIPIGIVSGPSNVNHSMSVQSMYLNLSCTKPSYLYTPSYSFGNYSAGTIPKNNNKTVSHIVQSQSGGGFFWWRADGSLNKTISTRSERAYRNASMDAFEFGYERVIAFTEDKRNLVANCIIHSTYVEAEVKCTDSFQNCIVPRIRRSKLDHPHANITQLDAQTYTRWNWPVLAEGLINAFKAEPSLPNLIDLYIGAPDNPTLVQAREKVWDSLVRPAEAYNILLGQLMNTYWSCMTAPYAMPGGLTPETFDHDASITFSVSPPTGSRGRKARAWRVEGKRSSNEQIFVADKGWVLALSIASVTLIYASLVPPLVRFFGIRGPDIMMNISSLATRNNPHIAIPPNGSYLDASDRSRMLRDHIVRFGDVDREYETGTLAIGSVDGYAETTISRVKRGRLYE